MMSLFEIASVASIGPFLGVLGDTSYLNGDNLLAQIYVASGYNSPRDFLFLIGLGVFGILATSSIISMFTLWRIARLGQLIGVQISNRLFQYYLYRPWLFHSSGSSSHLTKQITQEAARLTSGIIQPLMTMNAKIAMALFFVIGILIYNPVVAIGGVIIFGSAYFFLYRTVRRRLIHNGRVVSHLQSQRYKLLSEGFGGIRDVLLLGRQNNFIQRFSLASDDLAMRRSANQAISQIPRYAMELIAFGSVILLVLYLLKIHDGDLGGVLPALGVYALAGFKLLPAFQHIYVSLSQVKSNIGAFEAVRSDLKDSSTRSCISKYENTPLIENREELPVRQSIQLKNISFTYPGSQQPVLDGFNITIPAKQVVGIVGATGSGKSTAIDLLLGLIEPCKGQLLVDGKPIVGLDLRRWQNGIGFVPQSIFLADSSIRENVAFGLPEDSIDDSKVRQALRLAHLDELIDRLPNGLETRVGERGVQLSGGQCQRIGIARALYYDASVLVFDEATSSLDGITEKSIMDAIHSLSGMKTIIMIAHRLSTVKKCDRVYLLDNGRVIDQGNFFELKQSSAVFQHMAEHA